MSVLSDQTTKSEVVRNNMIGNTFENTNSDECDRRHLKRDSRHTIPDETTDWIPEIPFWNVGPHPIYNIIYSLSKLLSKYLVKKKINYNFDLFLAK